MFGWRFIRRRHRGWWCSIARQCPADAWVRLPADQPYLLKHQPQTGLKIPPPVWNG
jgi:hypothetical protein